MPTILLPAPAKGKDHFVQLFGYAYYTVLFSFSAALSAYC